ncbi:MAG: hypothetical protein NWF01_01275 [Candidatus Bathyarchaeota archaeon]|nr:hypothetical protein [Candidatus Bathyarchaeota archaeon]
MVLIEGLNLKAECIPKTQLIQQWKTLSQEPMPKIAAFRVEDEDFEHVLLRLNCPEDLEREILEWGRTLTREGTDACVFNGEENLNADYIILVRQNPYHSFNEIIRHELAHIAKGDL